jgi:cyanophycin synthetase
LLVKGLFMRRAKVGALLNVGNDHIGIDGINDLDAMAAHKSQVVVGSRRAVLNGDDPRSARYIDACGAGRVILFSATGAAPDRNRVIAAGGTTICGDLNGHMVLQDGGGAPQRVVSLPDIPITLEGKAVHYAADAMAAAAIAHGLGVPMPVVAGALLSFRGGMAENPGRWTSFDGYPFTLVAESGLSGAAFSWTARTVGRLAVKGRRIVLLSAVGNRTDGQYAELAAVAAPVFDRFIVYDLVDYRRGRAAGEVPDLLRAGLLASGVGAERIEIAPTLGSALAMASHMAVAGDFILVLTIEPHKAEREIGKVFARHLSARGIARSG